MVKVSLLFSSKVYSLPIGSTLLTRNTQDMKNTVKHWNPSYYCKTKDFRIDTAISTLKEHGCDFNNTTTSLLDLGCGDGKVTTVLADFFNQLERISAIDIDDDMLSHAKENNSHSLVNYSKENILTIPYHNDFDVVTSFACLHWIEEQDKVLSAVYNALRRGGQFVALLFPKVGKMHQGIQTIINQQPWSDYLKDCSDTMQTFTAESYEQLLSNAGFKQVSTVERIIYHEPGATGFGFLAKSWMPQVPFIPVELQDTFLEQIFEVINQNPVPLDTLTVSAYKP